MTSLASQMRRSFVVLVVAALAMAALLATGAAQDSGAPQTAPMARKVLDYTPQTGATFNRPVGPRREKRAVFTHINNTIDATPPGALIQFAVYSYAERITTDKLIAAHNRGVKVQMIFNKHHVFKQEKRLQRALGTNRNKDSFAIFCEKSCRGPKGQMHQKVFLFSKAGQAENIVMVGSNNMTRNNAVHQWSDVYTVADDPALYFTYTGVFDVMKLDRPQRTQHISARVNDYGPEFYPYPGVSEYNDPLYQALSQIECIGAAEGYGTEPTTETGTDTGTDTGTGTDLDGDGVADRVTMLRISMHAWNGMRGRYLAQKVADLKRQGCDVKVILGTGDGKVVRNTLARADVPFSRGSVKGIRTHQKAFYVSGVYAGDPASTRVWTGSHNWSNGALKRDDAVLEIDAPEAFAQYEANFEDIWNNG